MEQKDIPPFAVNTLFKCEKSTFDVRSEHPESANGLVQLMILESLNVQQVSYFT